ncbi:MAG: DHH family phosphoesterase, partial [Sphingomonadales bacterium]
MKPIADLYSHLTTPKKVVITTHQKPDADAMGSSLALAHYLQKKGHEALVVSPTNWAGFVNWMPGTSAVINYEQHTNQAHQLLDAADLLFCLDFNIFHRTKSMTEKLRSMTCTKVLIDHHQEPDTGSFDFGTSDTSKSSTCEMIYDFIVGAGDADLIDEDIATCIYAGVVGDTGSFRFSSAHAGVHALVADLKRRGLDHGKIHEGLYDNFLENRLRFIGHVLLHRMEILYEYNTALIAIPKSDLVQFNIRTGDTEGLVNYPQSIQGIRFAA